MAIGKLFIVATPIGNLQDITYRAIETLKEVDFVLCEDTRITKRLLDNYAINKPLMSYHSQSKLSKVDRIVELLQQGQNFALVTDAGTPGVSDPGNELIGRLLEHFQQEIEIFTIPGPAAYTALIQVAGINLSKFSFWGFPPNKKGRETFFRQILVAEQPIIYYESPYRILKNLELLSRLEADSQTLASVGSRLSDSQNMPMEGSVGQLEPHCMKIIVGRELTKMFEEVKRGSTAEILQYYQNNPEKVRGEFVIIAYR